MEIDIEEYNINKFKDFWKSEGEEIQDEQDLKDKLNKFIEQDLDLIF